MVGTALRAGTGREAGRESGRGVVVGGALEEGLNGGLEVAGVLLRGCDWVRGSRDVREFEDLAWEAERRADLSCEGECTRLMGSRDLRDLLRPREVGDNSSSFFRTI